MAKERNLLDVHSTKEIAHEVPLDELRTGHQVVERSNAGLVDFLKQGGSFGGRNEMLTYGKHFGPEVARHFHKDRFPYLVRELGFSAPRGRGVSVRGPEERIAETVQSLLTELAASAESAMLHEKPRAGSRQRDTNVTRGIDEAVVYLRSRQEDYIVQEYIPHGPLTEVQRVKDSYGLDINPAVRFIHLTNYDAQGQPQVSTAAFHYIDPRESELITEPELLPRKFQQYNEVNLGNEPLSVFQYRRTQQGAISVTENLVHYDMIRQVGEDLVKAMESRFTTRLPLISFDMLLTPQARPALEVGNYEELKQQIYFVEPQPVPDFFGKVYGNNGRIIHERGMPIANLLRKVFYGQNTLPISSPVFERRLEGK